MNADLTARSDDAPPVAAAVAAAEMPSPPPKIRLWHFFASIIPAAVVVLYLLPNSRYDYIDNISRRSEDWPLIFWPVANAKDYTLACGVQWLIAFGLAYYGWRTQKQRYVTEAIALLWFAPVVYFFILSVIERLMRL
jgi:hypothetical protein